MTRLACLARVPLLLVVLALTPPAAAAQSTIGCFAVSGAGGDLLARLQPVASVAPWLPDFPGLATTIDHQLSLIVAQAANRFGVYPSVRYYDDGGRPNAFAISINTEGSRHGSVRIGVNLVANDVRQFIQHEYGRTRGYTFGVTAVVAHELAHILQMQMGAAPPGPPTELQADFLAGWYFATLHADNPLLFESQRAIVDGIWAFYSRGDGPFHSPSHGTPAQRRDAFMRGFSIGPVPLRQAWVSSVAFRRMTRG